MIHSFSGQIAVETGTSNFQIFERITISTTIDLKKKLQRR